MDFEKEILAQAPTCRRGEGFADEIETDDNGNITGRAVPYDSIVELAPGLREQFLRGVFARQAKDPARIKICLEHGQVVGLVHQLEERDDGLWFHGSINRNPAIPEAAKAWAMVNDGLADELSIGFRTLKGGTKVEREGGNTLWTHTRAQLLEISVVPWGAYGREATLARAILLDPHEQALASLRERERAWLRSFTGIR